MPNFILGDNFFSGGDVLSNVRHLQASVGAACHAQDRPSHILLAIGIPREVASNALRLSVGRRTTKDDIDLIIMDLKRTVERLKQAWFVKQWTWNEQLRDWNRLDLWSKLEFLMQILKNMKNEQWTSLMRDWNHMWAMMRNITSSHLLMIFWFKLYFS
jgi:hypothetical protein